MYSTAHYIFDTHPVGNDVFMKYKNYLYQFYILLSKESEMYH